MKRLSILMALVFPSLAMADGLQTKSQVCRGTVHYKPVGCEQSYVVPSAVQADSQGERGQVTASTLLLEHKSTKLTHVWKQDGKERARIPLKAGAPAWRTQSRKRLFDKSAVGHWTVEVEDDNQNVIEKISFEVQPAEAGHLKIIPEAQRTAASQ